MKLTNTIGFSLVFFCTCLAACGGSGNGNGGDGGDGGSVPCDPVDHPCPEGERCNQDQECVPADPLEITTENLPEGRVGFQYDQMIEASGGLQPYTWQIEGSDTSLSFLSISFTGRLEGMPSEEVQEASITISVTDDGFAGGETVSRQYSISIVSCQEGDRELCYTAVGGVCFQGFKTCTNGQMGECVAGDDPSSDRRHCGHDCAECDGAIADGCVDGLCSCGGSSACEGDDNCCDGTCTDVSTSVENCGACENDCSSRIAHASGAVVSCNDGVCDYQGECDRGWLDCDDRRDNGCEQEVMVTHCGACDVDCTTLVTHVPSDQKTCSDTGSDFVCGYTEDCVNDFGDCDSDRSNGCEQYLLNDNHCGACGVACSESDAGSLCITPDGADPYNHVCGCRYDSESGQHEGCNEGWICCEHACRDKTSDSQHCGVCDAECTAGACIDGACECSVDDDCPKPSGGTSCGSSQCVCENSANPNAACPPGEYCCDGTAGGTGGPDGDPDLGCCPETCGWNDEDAPCVWE